MTALISVDLPLGVSSVLHYITTTHFSLIFSHSWLQRNSSHICGSLGLSSLCINIMSPPPTHFSLTHARTSFFISVTALTSVDLLVLQKNDYDKFLKDIRSSERREIYVCLVSTSTSSLLKHPLNAVCYSTLPTLVNTHYIHTPSITEIYVCLVSTSCQLSHHLSTHTLITCQHTLPPALLSLTLSHYLLAICHLLHNIS